MTEPVSAVPTGTMSRRQSLQFQFPPATMAASNPFSSAVQTQNEMSVHYHTIRHSINIALEEQQQQRSVHKGDTTKVPHPAHEIPADVAFDLGQAAGRESFNTDIHLITESALLAQLQTDKNCGLTSTQVVVSRAENGRNELTPPPSPNWLWLLVKQLLAGFNSILWLAALFAFLSYEPFGDPDPDPTQIGLGVVLVLVVVFNSAFNLYQEVKSVRIIASFVKMIPTTAQAIRDSRVEQLMASELVVGDVVKLGLGDKVPADIRLLESSGLQVNNSALTGEAEPVHCTTVSTHRNYLESQNLAFFSSLVVQGSGTGVVIATGDRTVLGTVSVLTRNSSQVEITSLHREINRFVLIIVGFAVFFAILIWITWSSWLNKSSDPQFHGYLSENGNIVNCIGLVVAFIPEGLPGAITLILTIVATRMYKQHVLVKSLATLETFNSVSVIATDKTGTLTMNLMTVTRLLWGSSQEYAVPTVEPAQLSYVGSAPSCPTPAHAPLHAAVSELLLGAALCNMAAMQMVDEGQGASNQIVGDAADTAMYKLQSAMKQRVDDVRARYPRVGLLPFNSTNKCMITAHTDAAAVDQVRVFMKGAPEMILERCVSIMADDGSTKPLAPDLKDAVLRRQEEFAKGGYRVIALVHQFISANQLPDPSQSSQELAGFPSSSYTFLGMFTLLDPPRPEVPSSVLKCREAQIRVAMVTGDHPATAAAIAYLCGILSKEITERNGLDSIRLVEDEMSRPCADILRNGVVIQRHPLGTVSHLAEPRKTLKSPSRAMSPTGKAIQRQALSPNGKFVEVREKVRTVLGVVWAHVRGQFLSSSPVTERAPTVPYGLVVTGSDLKLFDDWLWDWAVSHSEIVFARTSPEQKLRIVMQLQKRGEVVSVTGDGTNDAPALRRADLGVAMRSGTEVAREAGELVLLDNNFASIVKAIETGRLLGDNLKKVCVYLLPAGSWSELMPVLANEWIGMPLALSVFQMIVICMLTDMCGALAIVNEKAEENIMKRPPVIRNKEHLVDKRLIFHAYGLIGTIEVLAAFFNYLWWWNDNGIPPGDVFYQFNNFGSNTNYSPDELTYLNQKGQSIFFVTLVVMQFFNLISTRTRYASFFTHNPFYGRGRNLYLFVAMLCASLVAIVVTQPQWFNDTFHTQPVPVKYVAPALGFGTALFLIDEGRKYVLRNYPQSIIAKISW